MVEQGKPKRRIVPEQISSPTGASKHKMDALSGPLKICDLKKQSKIAGEKLGPGRKIYVNLRPYQKEHKQVNWIRLQREAGVSVEPSSRRNDSEVQLKPLEKFLSAITRTLPGFANQDDDSSDEDNDDVMFPRSETGEAFSGSDEEEDRQDGEDGDKNDEGEDGTGGDSNDEGNLSDDAPPKRRKKDSYDYMDDFIDDSEFIEMVEGGDKRKSTHQGFVIYQGKIERTGTLEEDNGRKRKRNKEAVDQKQKGPTVDSPSKKKTSKPYDMPDKVKEAIESIRKVVTQHSDSAPQPQENGEEGSKKRRYLPQPVKEEIIRNDTIFNKEVNKHGVAATNAILDELMVFLAPFTGRMNLRSYVVGKMGGKGRDEIVFSAKKIKAAVKDLKEVQDSATQPGSAAEGKESGNVLETNIYLRNMPSETRELISKQIKAGLKGETLESDSGMKVLKDIEECFPSKTINVDALKDLHRYMEDRRMSLGKGPDGSDMKSEKRSKEESGKGAEIIDSLDPDLSLLSIDDIVRKSEEYGVSPSKIREILESSHVKESEYLNALFKMLAVVGPNGLRLAYAAKKAQGLGMVRTNLSLRTVTAAMNKAVKTEDDIVHIKNAFATYALKCFPGVEPDTSKAKGEDDQTF